MVGIKPARDGQEERQADTVGEEKIGGRQTHTRVRSAAQLETAGKKKKKLQSSLSARGGRECASALSFPVASSSAHLTWTERHASHRLPANQPTSQP